MKNLSSTAFFFQTLQCPLNETLLESMGTLPFMQSHKKKRLQILKWLPVFTVEQQKQTWLCSPNFNLYLQPPDVTIVSYTVQNISLVDVQPDIKKKKNWHGLRNTDFLTTFNSFPPDTRV